jgi:predicted cupin superfamily sugar epimerase
MCPDADFWSRTLGLAPHPEGGAYRETWRAAESASGLPDRFGGPRALGTAILYLLRAGERSCLHRLRADELWHFHEGGPLHLHLLAPGEGYRRLTLGRDPGRGEKLQCVVPGGTWFGAEPAEGAEFALVGCTCAPGFEYGDFEMGSREDLLARFPEQRALVERLTP